MLLSNENRSASLPTWFRVLALVLGVAFAMPVTAGAAPGPSDIVVVSVRGDVRVTMLDAPRSVQAGAIVKVPATIRTGKDGAIDLRQGDTTVAIAADTEVELLYMANQGAQLERLIPTRGNAFYDVGQRKRRKLRVETPYLVAVIKGTQFNVAVQEDSSTISLFEGLLEVRTPDDSDIIELNAGEIAIRHANDRTIRVLRMDASKPLASTSSDASQRSVTPGGPDGEVRTPSAPSPIDAAGTIAVGRNPTIQIATPGGDNAAQLNVHTNAATAEVSLDTGSGALEAGIGVKLGETAATQIDAGVDVANGSVDVAAGAQVDVGVAAAEVAVDAGVDLGSGTVDVGADAAVNLGAASLDAGVDAGVNLGAASVDASADVAVDLGAAAADVGVDAAVDLGAGAVEVAADAAVDLGAASVDSALDVGADLAGGSVDLAADVGADLGAAAVDAGLDASLDSPAVDAGVDTSVAGIDLGVDLDVDLASGDVGLDVGLGGLDIGLGTDSGADPSPPETSAPDNDEGGLLGGLLGGRQRSN